MLDIDLSSLGKTNSTVDRLHFVVGSSVYAVTIEFLEEILSQSGVSLHCAVPLGVIDKVGFLKVGDEAKNIVVDVLAKYINNNSSQSGGVQASPTASSVSTAVPLSEYFQAMNADSE